MQDPAQPVRVDLRLVLVPPESVDDFGPEDFQCFKVIREFKRRLPNILLEVITLEGSSWLATWVTDAGADTTVGIGLWPIGSVDVDLIEVVRPWDYNPNSTEKTDDGKTLQVPDADDDSNKSSVELIEPWSSEWIDEFIGL